MDLYKVEEHFDNDKLNIEELILDCFKVYIDINNIYE